MNNETSIKINIDLSLQDTKKDFFTELRTRCQPRLRKYFAGNKEVYKQMISELQEILQAKLVGNFINALTITRTLQEQEIVFKIESSQMLILFLIGLSDYNPISKEFVK